jgi:nicotinate-nucleotide pyrophosphorylase (carboxylating)
MTDMDQDYIDNIVSKAVTEDLGSFGDVTSRAIFTKAETGKAIIKSKQSGVLSGTYLIRPVFKYIDPSLVVDIKLPDGSRIDKGSIICSLQGNICSILAGERIVLNFLQRLSGIATSVSVLVNAISHTSAELLDTRKTTPALRALEKRAVLDGGGKNHRFGLFDMILIKDTHVKAAGGVGEAIKRCRNSFEHTGKPLKIEAEVQTWNEFLEALEERPERIMLDNMDTRLMKACVERARRDAPVVELEASGNIDAGNIAGVAETGVDFISSGAITHSVKALDVHLVIVD